MTEGEALAALRGNDPALAARAEATLWQIWCRSGIPEILRQGIEAIERHQLAEAEALFTRIIERARLRRRVEQAGDGPLPGGGLRGRHQGLRGDPGPERAPLRGALRSGPLQVRETPADRDGGDNEETSPVWLVRRSGCGALPGAAGLATPARRPRQAATLLGGGVRAFEVGELAPSGDGRHDEPLLPAGHLDGGVVPHGIEDGLRRHVGRAPALPRRVCGPPLQALADGAQAHAREALAGGPLVDLSARRSRGVASASAAVTAAPRPWRPPIRPCPS